MSMVTTMKTLNGLCMRTVIALIALMLATPALALADPPSEGGVQSQLREANERFIYAGEPINPRAVSDLLTWLSDSLPGPVAIDLAGTHRSNRYFGDYTRKEDGSVFIDLSKPGPGRSEAESGGYFSYKRLGTLPGGIHVLATTQNGGGSGVFEDLLLVTFVADFEYQDDGSRRERLMMLRVGEIGLGDRSTSDVEIRGDTLRITVDTRLGKPARVLRFRSAGADASAGAAPAQDNGPRFAEPPAETYTTSTAQLTIDGKAQSVNAAQVTAKFFDAAHVRPYIGRFFIDGDYRAVNPVVVISFDLWQRGFGASAQIIGSVVKIGARSVTVVGVAPRDFAFPKEAQLWMPKPASPANRD